MVRRAAASLSMIAGLRPSPCSIPRACMKIENVQMSQARCSFISATSSSVASPACSMVDTPSSTHRRSPGPAVGVGRRVLPGPLRLLDRGPDLLARVDARVQRGARRADPAGGEDLDVIGPALEVLAHAAPDLVHAVEGGVRAAVAVARGDAARAAEQARARDHARLDRLAHRHVEEVLLGHHPQRGGPRGEVAAQVRRRAQGLGHRLLAELADLVAVPRHDRDVAVRVHQPRHHEAVAPVEHRGARGHRRGVGGADRGDPRPVHHHERGADGRRAGAVEQGAAADRAERGHRGGPARRPRARRSRGGPPRPSRSPRGRPAGPPPGRARRPGRSPRRRRS